MKDKRYKRYGNDTETGRNGGIPSVTFVTHPFRGVTDVTVPDFPKSVTRGSVSTGQKQSPTSKKQLADTGGFLTAGSSHLARFLAENNGESHDI